MIKPLLFIAVMFFASPLYAARSLAMFSVDSYSQILNGQGNNAFIIVLWSLDCPPCIKELVMLGRLHHDKPGMKLVLISTDEASRSGEINSLLSETGLSEINSWVFSSAPVMSLRYAIDPGWYGELPRSYFFTENHSRRALSGRINEQQLSQWLDINTVVLSSQLSYD